MPYSFDLLLPDEPILISVMDESYSIKHDFESFNRESLSQLDGMNQPVCHIIDIRAIKVNVFQDFLVAINTGVHGMETSVNHPNLIATIVVSTATLLKLAMKGMNSEIFGNLEIPVFDTLEEALAHARVLIAQEYGQR